VGKFVECTTRARHLTYLEENENNQQERLENLIELVHEQKSTLRGNQKTMTSLRDALQELTASLERKELEWAQGFDEERREHLFES
jgi:uncharacterized coiled-coil protein SlyX